MKTILSFLSDLEQNNNREWFAEHKNRYEQAKQRFEDYVNILIPQIKEFDPSVDVNAAKEVTFRIFRDVRFSKDKNPYKTNFGAYIAKGGRKSTLAGYYIHIQPGNESFAGGGIYCPMPDVLKEVRTELAENADPVKKIIKSKEFNAVFPELYGEKLKSAPKGFDKEHPDLELLKYKSYTVIHPFKDNELIHENFFETLIGIFKIQKPFNDYFNKIIAKSA